MADSGEVSIKYKIHGDKKGADEIAGGISNIQHRAAEANSKLTAGAQQSAGAFQKLSGSVGFLRRALTGFGAVALFSGIISGIGKVIDRMNEAKKASEEFDKKQKEIKASESLAAMERAYTQLADSISSANAQQERELDLINRNEQARRKLESAQLEAEKQAALAELSPDSIIYEEQKAQIEADFAARAEIQELANEQEDIVMKRQAENEKAGMKDREAEAEDERRKVLQEKYAQAQQKLSDTGAAAVNENEADAQGFFGNWGKNIKDIVTLDWGRVGDSRTREGDAIREKAADQLPAIRSEIEKLREEIRQSEEKSSELRAQGEHHRQVADSYSDELKANRIRRETADRAARKAERDTQAAKEAKMTEIRDDQRAFQELQEEKKDYQARKLEAQTKKDEAGRAVFAAQGDLEASQRRGDKRETQEQYYQKLQDAIAQQNETNYAADKLIEKIDEGLKHITNKLNSLSHKLEKTNTWNQYSISESASAE